MMNPGVTFTREAAQRIVRAVRAWERNSPVVSRPVRRTPLLADDDCVYVINNQGANAVAGSLLKLDSWSVTESRYGVSRPDATGLTEIGIACGAIDDGSEGWAWMTGTHVVLASAYADLTFGDKIGSQADSWYAAADDSGVLRVLGGVRAADQPGGLPAGVGLVRAGFVVGTGGAPENPGAAVDTLGTNTEGNEAADATTWTYAGTNGLEEWYCSRIGYFHAGDAKLYMYLRKRTYDKNGQLYSVSAETRVEVDAPEACV